MEGVERKYGGIVQQLLFILNEPEILETPPIKMEVVSSLKPRFRKTGFFILDNIKSCLTESTFRRY